MNVNKNRPLVGCLIAVVVSWISMVPGHSQTPSSLETRCREVIENKSNESDDARLTRLFDLHWNYLMTEYPEWATEVGYPGQNRRWTDSSLEAIAQRKKELAFPLEVINSIDAAKLSPE